ncbi:hypothetical protein [Pseudotamlana carrageenivorans]|uniref:Uncharacterized protein n=1 Tax=Pseudotamlana carrageenivorans TaxID=2069432 RepID=A0A2I7SJM8_9FLAO|nr:hypothetical protein [Tamlana carrageenivorans]AUS06116.1 hypothetical protein C1A40_11930 [Tamlana carrageenivorans]
MNILKYFFLLTSFLSFSQVSIVNSENLKPIYFIEIYSESGNLIAVTNSKGKLSKKQINFLEQSKSDSLEIYHSDYKSKIIRKENLFLDGHTIELSPVNFENRLEEVLIKAEKKRFVKLKSYFRSIQFNDERVHYYMDGIVCTYVDTKNFKIKIDIISNRSLQNKKIKQIDEKGIIQSDFIIAGVPDFREFYNEDLLKKTYTFKALEDSTQIYLDEVAVGRVNDQLNKKGIELQLYNSSNPKVMRFLGTESVLENLSIISEYKPVELKKVNFGDIKNFKEIREYRIKQKKAKDYTNIRVINEIYFLSKEFTNDKKGKSNFYQFLDTSNYNETFWNQYKNSVPSLPKSVESFVSEQMIE